MAGPGLGDPRGRRGSLVPRPARHPQRSQRDAASVAAHRCVRWDSVGILLSLHNQPRRVRSMFPLFSRARIPLVGPWQGPMPLRDSSQKRRCGDALRSGSGRS